MSGKSKAKIVWETNFLNKFRLSHFNEKIEKYNRLLIIVCRMKKRAADKPKKSNFFIFFFSKFYKNLFSKNRRKK